MSPDQVRVGVICGLTLLGVGILYLSERDPFIVAYGCFALAGVYALCTNPRRWL